jgi:endonuclease/exonuclease/phosphatase (EEP) superfamily protein YafD
LQTLSRALLWLLGGVCLATALALLAPLGWPFELFSHFRAQYAVAALLLAVLLGWQRRALPAMIALALAGWHALPGAQALLAAPAVPSCAGQAFTVITANVRYSNEQREPFLAWLDTQPGDLVVVQEVTTAWAGDLASVATYPHQRVLARDDAYGIAVLSRWPLESVNLVDLARDGFPSLAGIVHAGEQRVRFLGLHTHWPITPALARARDQALQGAAELARSADLPVVLLGDLNLTPESPAFDRLLRDAGLRDVMQGVRWRPTWAAGFWPLALRIDHILVSPGLCVEQAEVGPSIGSDHRPVLARLRTQLRSGGGPATGPAGAMR